MSYIEGINGGNDSLQEVGDQRPRPFETRPFSEAERQMLWTIGRGLLQRLRMNNALIAGGEEDGGIIDFDLAPEPSEEAWELIEEARTTRSSGPSNAAIVERLGRAIEAVEELDFPQFSFNTYQRDRRGAMAALQAGFLRAKLIANMSLFSARDGQEIPTLKFIKATQGVEPALIGSDRLSKQREKVAALFENLGYGEYTPENLDKYREAERLTSPEEIENHVVKNAGRFIDAINLFLDHGSFLRPPQKVIPSYDVKIESANDYWIAWSKGRRNQFHLLLNNHPRHAHKWTRGKAEQMALHEVVGHFMQMKGWQNAIDKGELLPVLGVTTVHDPEQVTSEGLAMSLHLLVPAIGSGISPAGLFEAEAEGLRQMVYNNVQIMVNSGQRLMRLSDVNKYVRRFCPAEPYPEIRNQVRDRSEHPIKRSYLYAYGYGYLFHRWAARNLTYKGSKELIKFVLSQPTTPLQEMRFVMSMIQDGGPQYGAIRCTFDDFIGQ